jgi:cyclopropane fatty-acyl-phospholipid synthase-like methyltransferase
VKFNSGVTQIEYEINYNEIEEYWEYNTISYTIFTDNTLHYGIWYDDTKTSVEAHENTNNYVASLLKLDKTDHILDAGCGVGGVSIYFADKYGVKATGISISKHQIKLARQNALKSPARDRVKFYHQNYIDTSFEDETFTKIFGLESVCYSRKKRDFLREAYRILKPRGILVVQDAYVIKTELNDKESKELYKFLKGWSLPNLANKKQFKKEMEVIGFNDIKFHEITQDIYRTIKTVYWNALIAFPITWILTKLGWIPQSLHETVIGGISQKRLMDQRVLTYGAFQGTK